METTIKVEFETPVQYSTTESIKEINAELATMFQFLAVFTNPQSSTSRLRVNAPIYLEGMEYFRYGFGSNHMWIKQVTNGFIHDDRLLIITF